MSHVQLVVRDATQDLSGPCHGSDAQRAVAALSADPVTIEELEVALERFMRPLPNGFFADFEPGLDDRPLDAGLVVIDLAARLVVVEGSPFAPAASGKVRYHDGAECTPIPVWYDLSPDWLLLDESCGWRSLAVARREELAARPPRDVRAVLYGTPLLEFVASECFVAFPRREMIAQAVRGRWAAARRAQREASSLPDHDPDSSPFHDTLKEIHARWLMTPLEEFDGKVPRDVLLADRERRMRDMQYRCDQWSITNECPRGVDPTAHAFRFAGFGTHELVVYYYLVRELLWSTWDRLMELNQSPHESRRPAALTRGDFLADEVRRLEQYREQWLDTPYEEFGARTPRSIIDLERSRIPETVSGDEAMVDPDCPCCQMLAELPGPLFWSLDSSCMDDEFAFDIYHTDRDEWDRRYDYLNSLSARDDDDSAGEEPENHSQEGGDNWGIDEQDATDTVWLRSYSRVEASNAPRGVRLFGVGCHLAELLEDLRDAGEDADVGNQLNRCFGNLRDVLGAAGNAETASLVEPVVTRMQDLLDNIVVRHSELERKCSDLSSKLARFLLP